MTTPAKTERSPEQQAKVDAEAARLVLYKSHPCPYCVVVKNAIDRLNLKIATRDTRDDPAARKELVEKGGMSMVPCLRVTHEDGRVEWMYESRDIINFLMSKFSK